MIVVEIDRSTIRRNPDAGRREIMVPGRSAVGPDGTISRQMQRIYTIFPDPEFLFKYEPTEVKCSKCGAIFDVSKLESYEDFYTYAPAADARICPECGEYQCCEPVEWEKPTAEMLPSQEKQNA